MSVSRVVRAGAATRSTRQVLLTVTTLVLTAAACSQEAGVEETATPLASTNGAQGLGIREPFAADDLPSAPDAWSRYWLESPPGTGGVTATTAGGPGLVAMGGSDELAAVWTSSNGRTWSRVPGDDLGPGTILDVTVGGPGLVAVGTEYNELARVEPCCDAAVWTSENGLAWNRAPDDPIFRDTLILAVAAGGPGLVAVAEGPDGPQAWFSSDGLTWDQALVPPVNHRYSMTEIGTADNRLVVVGTTRREVVIWTSTDGKTWTDVPLDPDVFPPGRDIADVTHGPNGFVAVGSHNQGVPPTVWTSADGLQWHRVPSDQEAFISRVPLPRTSFAMWSVAAGKGGYMAVGADGYCWEGGDCPSAEAAIWTSTNGESWIRVPTDPLFQPGPGHKGSAAAERVVAWGSRFVVTGEYAGREAVWISPTASGENG